MESYQAPRVVPSGKVYRQIFDAEVQLVRALEGKPPERLAQDGDKSHAASTIPVVKDSRGTIGTGMLNERQKTWIDGFPNESTVENPVLIKYYTDEERQETTEPESHVASKEVRGLPDVLAPVKKASDIIERIAESRKLRHETIVEDMHQELGIVSSDMEPRIKEIGENLIVRLSENDKIIESIMERMATDEDLICLDESGLGELWEEAASQSVLRLEWIHEMDASLTSVEEDRMRTIREIFQNYSEQLEKTAHLMAPDLQRLLDKESQLINQTVLSNRRAYGDLYARLMMSDVEREKILHTQWKQRMDDWKRLHTQISVQAFCEFMQSDPVLHPEGARKVLEFMKAEQEGLNCKRLDLINTLRNLKPPTSTKTLVYQWNEQLTEVSKQIDGLNQKYFAMLYGEYEAVCQRCLEEVDTIKEDFIKRGVCTPEVAQQVVNDQCLPLVGERQTKFEKELEVMDKTLEAHNAYLLGQLKSLFKFCQGTAHVWDVHELGLAKQERHLQEILDECRHKHDNQNQDKEANLDITMDRMRQDANEKNLQESLRKALDLLEKIKEGYYTFHSQQTEIVENYPKMVGDELNRYDHAVLKFFGLARPPFSDGDKDDKYPGTETPTPRPKSKNKKRAQAGSRASIEPPKVPVPVTPPPDISGETLTSTNGSVFNVLLASGEHGIPAQTGNNKDQEESEENSSTFLTESLLIDKSDKPDYIISADVSDDLILDVKKAIRMNFINHLEEWCAQAIERANSVVSAKTEELNSELDLRQHLHDPRARRAELDVHNVRAAELVMHNERVSRHCKGINQALSDLKHRFNQMTQEHNKLADKFRHDIEALEVVFVNATKSSKLVTLSNQLQIEQDKYMEVIRASLRQFRQHLDDTLQMLRESNARFIKSFKLFSDGGNFCPEEIEEYRKRLEKMSNKIDSSEGFIMADLEGMESKRLEQASKISAEFEDRFKHHMIDLLFMEKIARWLTNTQVKIKAEVADSNSQAQRLAQFLNDLERRIDACERPNLDKEQVTPTQLNDSLKPVFEAYHQRSGYLNANKRPSPRPYSGTMQGNPALGARVGFAPETVGPIHVSKAGKQPVEDPTVGVIKNILKTQKARLQFGADAQLDGEIRAPPVGTSHGSHHAPSMASNPTGVAESREKVKSRQSRLSEISEVRSKKSGSKPGTANNSVTTEPKRNASGPVVYHPTVTTYRKGNKIDKKYYVFGEGEEEGEEMHFLGRIKKVLREALDGLLSASDMYYRQKGNRAVTRPQALQETFEQCADTVVHKLQLYYSQCDQYHNQCLQELRRQLDSLEDMVAHIPPCVIRELLARAIEEAKSERTQLDEDFAQNLEQWDTKKSDHQSLLRPALGHPMHSDELKKLCEAEDERRKDKLEGVENHSQTQQGCAGTHGQGFIDRLARTAEQLFLQFDNLLTVDDVVRGRVPPKKHATSELIRRKNAGIPLEDDEDKDKITRGKKTWQGLPKNEITSHPVESEAESRASKASKSKTKKKETNLTAAVTTGKTTLGHFSTQEARDKAYEDYKAHYQTTLASIEDEKQKQVIAEQRWTESWQTSVNKVKQLY